MDSRMILTVTDVNTHMRGLVSTDEIFASLFVRGEISNYKLHTSGHAYLTLKDEGGVLRAVMFRANASKLKFRPENGMKIIAHGRIDVFTRDGQYQLYIDDMTPDGLGALYIAYEQLKQKLTAQGLFDARHKKPLPRCPMRIALVTSPTGAAVRDMLRILKARWPLARVRIYPVRVQGTEAPGEICAGIKFINDYRLADVIITGRGGGSLEDLWAFNDEGVARAIFASEIPVISAVGHEPDYTIADFVADVRAATPSNAAELAVPDRAELAERLKVSGARILQLERQKIAAERQRVSALTSRRVLKSPMVYIEDKTAVFAVIARRFEEIVLRGTEARRIKLSRAAGLMQALSPLKVLSRGYAMVTDSAGGVVKTAASLCEGDMVGLRFEDSGAQCLVMSVNGGSTDGREKTDF